MYMGSVCTILHVINISFDQYFGSKVERRYDTLYVHCIYHSYGIEFRYYTC